MSDTDRRDISATQTPKARERRVAQAAAKGVETESGAAAPGDAHPEPASPQIETTDPAPISEPPAQETAALAGSDGEQASRPMPREKEAKVEAGLPAARQRPPEGPWRDGPPSPSPVIEPPPPVRPAGRGLALLALLLSIALPGALYAYLSESGVFNRDANRLTRLEASVESLRSTPAPKPDVARADLDKLAARLDQIEKTVVALGQRPPAPAPSGAAPTAEAAAQIEAASRDAKEAAAQAKSAAQSAAAAQDVAARIGSLESEIAELEKRLAAAEQAASARPKASSNAPSMLVLSRTVSGDLSSGAPYAGELDALARLGADAALVEALKPFAEKGAPSPASLVADFQAELAAARAKVAEQAPPKGFWGRFAASLGHLVRVRNVGGDDPGSPAASVETALTRGDVAAALDAWNSLPVFEKSATPVSGARIKALAGAYEAARRISAAALEAVRRAGSAENGG